MKMTFRRLSMAVAVSVIATQSLAASMYNGGDVRIISPHGIGVSDLMARVMAEHLTAKLSQNFGAEPATGASSASGARTLAKVAPDGCTPGIIGLSRLVTDPQVETDIGCDPQADFSPVAMIVGPSAVRAVNSGPRRTSCDQLVASMTAGRLVPTLATSGKTTITAILPMTIFGRLGLKSVIVPFKDATEAAVAATEKNLHAVSPRYSILSAQFKAGAQMVFA